MTEETKKLSSMQAIRTYFEGDWGGFAGRKIVLEEVKVCNLPEADRLEIAKLCCKAMGAVLVDSSGNAIPME